MPHDTYSSLKLKIEKEIVRLQKQAKALQNKRRAPVLTSIVRSMREYDITPEEVATAFNKKNARVTTQKPGDTVRRPVPAKYRHPETGDTWTGRGKAPRWIVNAEAEGKKRDDFLIQP